MVAVCLLVFDVGCLYSCMLGGVRWFGVVLVG